MRNIKILDCTLRDGGYINNWNFGVQNIKKIIHNLNQANIDIIECGFLRDDIDNYADDNTNYENFDSLLNLGDDLFQKNRTYALMMLTEKCDVNKLCSKNQNLIDTIRLSFHKRDMKKGIEDAKKIKEKGYQLFLQPTATMRYNDDELKEFIKICNNEIHPDSVAIVDTFGEMLGTDIIHFSKLFDQYLDSNITLSFHSHNNIQTAYSNALLFIDNTSEDRNIVIDASIYGMGRGAGNLCTELIINYLNKEYNTNYQLYPILEVADSILSDIKKEKYWGYSLEYYLSAINHCHPNYCNYFSSQKTLTTYDLGKLIESISEDKRIDFDKEYAEELYYSYNNKTFDDQKSYNKLKRLIENKTILLLGPGKSINDYHKKIQTIINKKNKYFVIAINHYPNFQVDAYFFSNRKRYYDEKSYKKDKYYLFTSNIEDNQVCNDNKIFFDYNGILARDYKTTDNALILFLNILKKLEIKEEILLAGFDGYDHEQSDNYYNDSLLYLIDKNRIDELNFILTTYINLYRKCLSISFLTPSKYE